MKGNTYTMLSCSHCGENVVDMAVKDAWFLTKDTIIIKAYSDMESCCDKVLCHDCYKVGESLHHDWCPKWEPSEYAVNEDRTFFGC